MKIPSLKSTLFTLFFFSTVLAIAQPAGWSHLQPVRITENSGTTLTNYQIRLSINTQAMIAAGQLQSSGNDLRFGADCQGTKLFNYWIESGVNTASTVIWVKVDSLPASQESSIFMYFGNPAAGAVSAIQGTLDGPFSTTDSLSTGSTGYADSSQYGFRFIPAEDILVTSFGKYEPTGNTRYITLFDYSSQAILQQLQVSGSAAQYNYSGLASPLWLTMGTQYLLEIYQLANDGYYFNNFNQASEHIYYADMRYCNHCTENTFPTSYEFEAQYGYPDMLYYVKKSALILPSITIGTIDEPFVFDAGATVNGNCISTGFLIGGAASGGGNFNYSWSPAASLNDATVAVPVASPTVTTTYTATVTSSIPGCVVIDTVRVVIPSPPTISITAPSTSVCTGSSITLSGMGGNTYVWQPGNNTTTSISVAPTVATTYSVVGTDAITGCSAAAQFNVSVLPLPAISITGNTTVCMGSPLSLTGVGGNSYVWSTGDSLTTISVSPTIPVTYTVTGTDAFGCINTATHSVAITALPLVTVSGDTLVCEATAATLTASGASTYSWLPTAASGSTFTFSPTTTTTITVVGTALTGCSDSSFYIVQVDSVPPVQIISTSNTICLDDAPLLLNSNPTTGSFSGPGMNDNSFDPMTTGAGTFTIYYTYVHTNGCSMQDSLQIAVSACVGIAEQGAADNLQLYPNPASDQIIVKGSLMEKTNVAVYDSRGRLLLNQTCMTDRIVLNTSELTKGVYVIQITTGDGHMLSRKLVINR